MEACGNEEGRPVDAISNSEGGFDVFFCLEEGEVGAEADSEE